MMEILISALTKRMLSVVLFLFFKSLPLPCRFMDCLDSTLRTLFSKLRILYSKLRTIYSTLYSTRLRQALIEYKYTLFPSYLAFLRKHHLQQIYKYLCFYYWGSLLIATSHHLLIDVIFEWPILSLYNPSHFKKIITTSLHSRKFSIKNVQKPKKMLRS